jgi:protein-disulfide reductase (glutathione)
VLPDVRPDFDTNYFTFYSGFGSQYEWLSLSDGLKEAKENGKPVMVLIHKSWCGACKGNEAYFFTSNFISLQ